MTRQSGRSSDVKKFYEFCLLFYFVLLMAVGDWEFAIKKGGHDE